MDACWNILDDPLLFTSCKLGITTTSYPTFFVSGDIKSPLKYARLELVDYQLYCFLSANFIAWNCNDMLISYPRLVALKRFEISIPKNQNWFNH